MPESLDDRRQSHGGTCRHHNPESNKEKEWLPVRVGKKGFDLGFGEKEILPGMHAVETDKLDYPINVGVLRLG